jgi:hypothetical protein
MDLMARTGCHWEKDRNLASSRRPWTGAGEGELVVGLTHDVTAG